MRLIAGIFLLGATMTSAMASNVFTPTSGHSCSGTEKPEFNVWRCPGPGGYVAEFSDEGNLVGVAIAKKNSLRGPAITPTVNFRGSGRVFGDKLQWIVEDGKPTAAILRVWRVQATDEGTESEVQELIVLKIEPAKACEFAVVNARQPSANELAAARALEAARFNCMEK